jgi:hypothetical protein
MIKEVLVDTKGEWAAAADDGDVNSGPDTEDEVGSMLSALQQAGRRRDAVRSQVYKASLQKLQTRALKGKQEVEMKVRVIYHHYLITRYIITFLKFLFPPSSNLHTHTYIHIYSYHPL